MLQFLNRIRGFHAVRLYSGALLVVAGTAMFWLPSRSELDGTLVGYVVGGDQDTGQGGTSVCKDINWPPGSQGSCLQEYTLCPVRCGTGIELPTNLIGPGSGYQQASSPQQTCTGERKLGWCTYDPEGGVLLLRFLGGLR